MPYLVRPIIVEYVDAFGRRVPKGTRGSKKQKRRASKWYGVGMPGKPPTKRVPLATDKTAAKRMMDDAVRYAERGQAKLPDANAGVTPLAEYLNRFEQDLRLGLASRSRAKGERRIPSEAQVSLTIQRVRDCLSVCGFAMPSDLGAGADTKLAKHLAARRGLARRDGGLSAQSEAFVLAAMKRFVWWLATRGRAPVSVAVFDAVAVPDPDANRVHARRPATPAEVEKLLATVKDSPVVRRGLTGLDRYHLWTLAFSTGLRAGELAILTPRHFRLDHEPPAVVLAAKETKNGQAVQQPLPLPVAKLFRDYLADKPAAELVWPGRWPGSPVWLLKRDLIEAGIDYCIETPDGPKFLDVHSLRHTYVTTLAAAGVGVKELQELARHSDAQTTLNIYTHATKAGLTDSVARLVVPGVTGGTTISDLPRAQLESLAAVALSLVEVLVARRVALTNETNRDNRKQTGTNEAVKGKTGKKKKP